ncbi:unnamed protein product [Moneuplotes crassus]|uniref:Macro domain-containing protein n=1 Tax=Euplotes crassus TaxID=5936 RepID=A0AAD1X8Q0_EUPCR|nr:unnamed protein product [Moneuplotes crassus]
MYSELESRKIEKIKEQSLDVDGDRELSKLNSIDIDQTVIKCVDLDLGENQKVYMEMLNIEDELIEHLDVGKMDSDRDLKEKLIKQKINELGVKMDEITRKIKEVKDQAIDCQTKAEKINQKIYQDHINGSTFKKLSSNYDKLQNEIKSYASDKEYQSLKKQKIPKDKLKKLEATFKEIQNKVDSLTSNLKELDTSKSKVATKFHPPLLDTKSLLSNASKNEETKYEESKAPLLEEEHCVVNKALIEKSIKKIGSQCDNLVKENNKGEKQGPEYEEEKTLKSKWDDSASPSTPAKDLAGVLENLEKADLGHIQSLVQIYLSNTILHGVIQEEINYRERKSQQSYTFNGKKKRAEHKKRMEKLILVKQNRVGDAQTCQAEIFGKLRVLNNMFIAYNMSKTTASKAVLNLIETNKIDKNLIKTLNDNWKGFQDLKSKIAESLITKEVPISYSQESHPIMKPKVSPPSSTESSKFLNGTSTKTEGAKNLESISKIRTELNFISRELSQCATSHASGGSRTDRAKSKEKHVEIQNTSDIKAIFKKLKKQIKDHNIDVKNQWEEHDKHYQSLLISLCDSTEKIKQELSDFIKGFEDLSCDKNKKEKGKDKNKLKNIEKFEELQGKIIKINSEINDSKAKFTKQKYHAFCKLESTVKVAKVKSIILESIKSKIKRQLTTCETELSKINNYEDESSNKVTYKNWDIEFKKLSKLNNEKTSAVVIPFNEQLRIENLPENLKKIANKAGDELTDACKHYKNAHFRLRTGLATLFPGGNLNINKIIAAVGPICLNESMEALMKKTVYSILDLMLDYNFKSILIPSFSTKDAEIPEGLYLRAMVEAIKKFIDDNSEEEKGRIVIILKSEDIIVKGSELNKIVENFKEYKFPSKIKEEEQNKLSETDKLKEPQHLIKLEEYEETKDERINSNQRSIKSLGEDTKDNSVVPVSEEEQNEECKNEKAINSDMSRIRSKSSEKEKKDIETKDSNESECKTYRPHNIRKLLKKNDEDYSSSDDGML